MTINLSFSHDSDDSEPTSDLDRGEVEDLSPPQWRRYEETVQEIYEQKVIGGTKVEATSVPGLHSGIPRQIDVLLRTQIVDDIETLIVIECKRYKARVGIGTVDEFFGKLADVGAQHGVLCAPNGFTAGARKRADPKARPSVTLVDLSADERLDLSVFDVVFDCPALGCEWGELRWAVMTSDADERVGFGSCERCGGIAIRCETCENVEEPGIGFECSCGHTFTLSLDRDHEIDYVVRTDSSGQETTFDRWGEPDARDGVFE